MATCHYTHSSTLYFLIQETVAGVGVIVLLIRFMMYVTDTTLNETFSNVFGFTQKFILI